jgi:hypothetical protein
LPDDPDAVRGTRGLGGANANESKDPNCEAADEKPAIRHAITSLASRS